MSLLMDALKKAELAKRKSQSAGAAVTTAAADLSRPPGAGAAQEPGSFRSPAAPAPAASNPAVPFSASSLPSLPDRLELLDNEFALENDAPGSQPSFPPPSSASDSLLSLEEPGGSRKPSTTNHSETTASAAANREAIRNLFETKQTPASRKSFMIAISTFSLVAVIVMGGYFWYQLQPKPNLLTNPNPALLLAGQPPLQGGTRASPSPAAEEAGIPGLPPKIELQEKNALPPEKPAAGIPAASPPTPAQKKLFQLSKTAAPQIDPALERGYAALKREDATAAKSAYEQALASDPHNIDALSGLAVLAQRAGNPEQAADYYLRILEADPHQAFALAGLINLQARLNPAEAETRLRQALATQPDSAALNFSLGNLYSAAKRWSDAQQAYFKAVAADSGNPDYLFNLAVSLDQLRQPKLAADYYAQALAAAGNRPGSFDKTQAGERLRQLQQ